jgi:parallel beta-helix repeat protein
MRWTRIGGTAALLAALAIALAVFWGLWGHWTASAQDTFIVNDDTSPAADGCDTPDFETEDIQDAIDSGLVCEGTYNPPDSIQVTKELIIEGRAAADRDAIVVEGVASDGFDVSADNVVLRHLTLEGSGTDRGIWVSSDNNTIEDMEIAAWASGVRIMDGENNVVETSEIHDNADRGFAPKSGGENTVGDNDIPHNDWGVYIDSEDGDLVEGNTLSGNTREQIRLAFKVNARIERNNIATSSDGIFFKDMSAESLVIIGGSPENANTFTGPFGGGDYYVNLSCASENTVDATYNWWGSTTRVDIANRIFNDEDDAGTECAAPDDVKGAVVFHPWATGPAPTPTPSPTSTPTPTPTATATATPPGATRTIDLSPQGWHDLAWSGADATDPGAALACISGDYSIAYAWEGPTAGFKRYVEGCAIPGICNMAALNKYDALLVNISAAGVSCEMPITP